jgi:hypothetical protein
MRRVSIHRGAWATIRLRPMVASVLDRNWPRWAPSSVAQAFAEICYLNVAGPGRVFVFGSFLF